MLEQTEQTQSWSHNGTKKTGVLVIHGFTSTPASMRPVADALAKEGLDIELPRLPGHGTQWEDLEKTRFSEWEETVLSYYDQLSKRCERVFVVGLSMGGALAARVAELRSQVDGVVLINHALLLSSPLLPLVPILKFIMRTTPAIAGDIYQEGVREIAYNTVPVRAVHEMLKMTKRICRDLGKIKAPVLIFKSRQDHVVPIKNINYTMKRIASREKQIIWLEKSYHVATQDVEVQLIIKETLKFIRNHKQKLEGE